MFTQENISTKPDGLHSLKIGEDDTVSVGFAVDDGHNICLALHEH